MKVLAAEDNEILSMLLARTIASMGWDYVIAKNGNEAVELMRKEKFDVVLLDIHMPVMDGFEAANWIRNNLKGRNRPFLVALTGSGGGETEERCRETGFDMLMEKPLDPEKLKTALKNK